MADLRDTMRAGKGKLEVLLDKIPGYGGYREKNARREADRLLREHLASRLAEQLRLAEDVGRQMLTGSGLSQLDEMGQANTRLQTVIDRVKTAAQGYSGFFDAVKVKEEQLDMLYDFDDDMLLQVNDVAAAVEAVQAALDSGDDSKLAPAVRRYGKTVADFAAAFDKRKDTLLGLA